MFRSLKPEWNLRKTLPLREKVDTSPERYLLIPGRDHGEHHDILREF